MRKDTEQVICGPRGFAYGGLGRADVSCPSLSADGTGLAADTFRYVFGGGK